MAEMPRAKDLFDGSSPVEAAERMDSYTYELSKSLSNASSVPGQAPASSTGTSGAATSSSESSATDTGTAGGE